MDIKAYYRVVRETESSLNADNPSGYVYVTSIENREKNSSAGSLAECSTFLAAKHIVERTGRLSTKEEIDRFHEAASNFKARMQTTGPARRKNSVVLVLEDPNARR